MMEVNILKCVFIFNSLFMVFVGNIVNFLEDKLPTIVVQSFLYGKFSYVSNSSILVIEIPKRWFKHFYIFSSIFSLVAIFYAINTYVYNAEVPLQLLSYLDIMCGSSRKSSVDPLSTLIFLALMCLQCFRRFYETHFISVFSNVKINLAHYALGFIHYGGALSIVLAEAQGFGSVPGLHSRNFLFQLSPFHVIGVILFGYAWFKQFECAVILANLRKDSSGSVVTSAHKIPKGGLFDVLSSPHLTCEVLIYLSLYIILRQSSTFPFVFLWVLVNQVEVAFLNHWWYKKNFKNYPKKKKAFIPYIL